MCSDLTLSVGPTATTGGTLTPLYSKNNIYSGIILTYCAFIVHLINILVWKTFVGLQMFDLKRNTRILSSERNSVLYFPAGLR